MDRALDEIVQENQRARRGGRGGGRGGRRDDRPRDQDRKNGRDDRAAIDKDWIHDRYDDERGDIRGAPRRERRQRRSPEREREDEGVKLRIENLHYDLTEDDLEDLFTRIAPISGLTLTYDRSGRSTGTAYVTYRSIGPAREAIKEFDGANANGQPIRLSIVPGGPGGSRRNPFDSAVQPGRSLFDRVEDGKRSGGGGSRARHRSRSPRRSDITKPAPEHIDRYIPAERRSSRSRSPPPRRRGGGGDRRDGRREPRRDGRGDHRSGEGARLPRKTQDQLDREMDEYWNKKPGAGTANADGASTGAGTATAAAGGGDAALDMDLEMAE